MNLIDDLVAHHEEMTGVRRDLHRHPELAYEEHRTADVVAERLTAWGIPIRRGLGGTGVVGTLRCGPGNGAIGLRADMDALAMDELNTFEHASRHPGRMHGCGHDGHTTMLLGAARHLAAHQGFDGTVHFIFQPAEEGAGGADAMIRDGLFDEFPVDSVWGMHNFPTVPVGKFITRTGPFLASSDTVRVTVNGVGGHGAMPHLARSPVNAACAIIEALNDFIAQEINAQNAATFTVGRIRGGDAINVIPDSVEFAGTVRSFTHSVRESVRGGPRPDRQRDLRRPRHLRRGRVREELPAPRQRRRGDRDRRPGGGQGGGGGERRRRSGPHHGLGGLRLHAAEAPRQLHHDRQRRGRARGCMVHNPHYDFNDEILPIGATYWVELARELLPPH